MGSKQSATRGGQPYLWRYREDFNNGKEMDLLFIPGQTDPPDHSQPGETTIITWVREESGISPAEYQSEKPGIPEAVDLQEGL